MSEVRVSPVKTDLALKGKVYNALKEAITTMDIYSTPQAPKLDERRLADELGVSRTPVREAISRLEQEGLVKSIPRRGAFVVRKCKREILEMIHVWAALESMAARIATLHASDEQIGRLRAMFATFGEAHAPRAHIDEYSETNIHFHQAIVGLADNDLLQEIADGLFIHMRSIRVRTIKDSDRAQQSIIDHMRIIEAIENRATEQAENLVREHALSLAAHVDTNVDYLD